MRRFLEALKKGMKAILDTKVANTVITLAAQALARAVLKRVFYGTAATSIVGLAALPVITPYLQASCRLCCQIVIICSGSV
ncbi:hypothetical protein P6U16_27475 (plasmid) [Rhizobium sp. 32-5/1]|uniref:hypothetical protein n=1 Tax=Rhizobium sp. 32-5/1 TaxID=3019602 RepID=UPI00240E0115|nr:hypothetical protein [Rhizobium sp. 32-5/1]WEZ86291.1 hypothetical protein P6U16_27475 [Rhizobium sp. 32-5/1]